MDVLWIMGEAVFNLSGTMFVNILKIVVTIQIHSLYC